MKEVDIIEIPVRDILASESITEKDLADILGKVQSYINRKKKGNFYLILKVLGTSENTRTTDLIKRKTNKP